MTTILAIESSCDETGIGIAELADDGTVTLLADAVASSVDEHARFGGVVPEIASRAHLEAMVPTVHRALEAAGVARAAPGARSRSRRAGGSPARCWSASRPQGRWPWRSASRSTGSTTCRATWPSTC